MAGRNPEASETPNLVEGEVVFHLADVQSRPPISDQAPQRTPVPTPPIAPQPVFDRSAPSQQPHRLPPRHMPPQPRKAPTAELMRSSPAATTVIAPLPQKAPVPAAPVHPVMTEEAPASKGRGKLVLSGVGLALAAATAFAYHNFSGEADSSHNAAAEAPTPSESSQGDQAKITQPDTVEDSPLLIVPEQQTPADPTTPDAPATTPTVTPSAPTGKKSTAHTKSTPKTVVPSVAPAPQHTTTSSAPRTSSPTSTSRPTPAPTRTSREQIPAAIGTVPESRALRLLSNSADTQRAHDLSQQYENFSDYLRAPQAGELNFLNARAVNDYQSTLKSVYSNPEVHHILGDPQLLSAARIAAGGNPASTLVSFGDTVLQHAPEVFNLVGSDISKTAYLNPALASDLTDKLSNQVDYNRSFGSNEAIVGEVDKVHDIAVVPIVASHGDSVIFQWDALIPVSNSGDFIGVPVYEKTLELPQVYETPPSPENPATISPEPEITSPSPSLEDTILDGLARFRHHK